MQDARRPPGAHEGPAPVLVVDDDADLRTLLTHLLDVLGHPVAEAGSGAEALETARREPPALVLLDVHLPDISGYEVCRELRDTFGEHLPIMFISGTKTEAYDHRGGLLLGADDYVFKPFAHDELLARVRRLLARSMYGEEARNFD